LKRWSHPPGSNRRPADYETIQSPQIVENAVHRPSFAPAIQAVVAQVEQVSEQVEAHVVLPTTTVAEVVQVRRLALERIRIKDTGIWIIFLITPQAHGGES
jgi:hypothetical protein